MRKSVFIISLTVGVLFSHGVYAWEDDDGEWRERGRYEQPYRPQPYYREVDPPPYYREETVYLPPQPVYREEVRYYPQPAPPPYPYYPRDDGRAYRQYDGGDVVSEVAGGMVGGVVGYELGGGSPMATGVGAVAGAIFGDEMGR